MVWILQQLIREVRSGMLSSASRKLSRRLQAIGSSAGCMVQDCDLNSDLAGESVTVYDCESPGSRDPEHSSQPKGFRIKGTNILSSSA